MPASLWDPQLGSPCHTLQNADFAASLVNPDVCREVICAFYQHYNPVVVEHPLVLRIECVVRHQKATFGISTVTMHMQLFEQG